MTIPTSWTEVLQELSMKQYPPGIWLSCCQPDTGAPGERPGTRSSQESHPCAGDSESPPTNPDPTRVLENLLGSPTKSQEQ